MEVVGKFGISSPQHEDLFSLGSLTPNPFYIIYRHELSKILSELAIYGVRYKEFIMEVKFSKYLSYKVYKWWYSWIIFKDDWSIHMENSSKEIDDGVKEGEKGWKTNTIS